MTRELKSRYIRIGIALFLLAFFTNAAFAQKKSVATFTRVEGSIVLVNDKRSPREVHRGQVVYSGDRISTGKDGWATINFFDLTRVVLRPNSEFTIDKFPQKIGAGRVELSLTQGAIRVTTGTISNSSVDHFMLNTPQGRIVSSRSEWVVRLCQANECPELHDDLKICRRFDHHTAENQAWVSVYKGNVGVEYCDIVKPVKRGMSVLHQQATESCELVDYIPCAILADRGLGRDKLRRFMPLLNSFEKEPPEQGIPPSGQRPRPPAHPKPPRGNERGSPPPRPRR